MVGKILQFSPDADILCCSTNENSFVQEASDITIDSKLHKGTVWRVRHWMIYSEFVVVDPPRQSLTLQLQLTRSISVQKNNASQTWKTKSTGTFVHDFLVECENICNQWNLIATLFWVSMQILFFLLLQ